MLGRVAINLLRFVVVPLVLLFTVASWVAADIALHPPDLSSDAELAVFPALKADLHRVAFFSRAEPGRPPVRLVGRFFPGRSHATIFLTHGYGYDQNQVLQYAAFLHHAGYSVLTYNTRTVGGSGGPAATLGALEQDDALGALDYVASRRDVDRTRIGALGISLGAAITILAAARDIRIRAVVADSSFADAHAALNSAVPSIVHLPAVPFALLTVALAEASAGVSLNTARPIAVVARISPRPILFIHGLADTYIPPTNSIRLYWAARPPKTLWLIPGVGHTGGYAVMCAAYEQRVVRFFRRSIGL